MKKSDWNVLWQEEFKEIVPQYDVEAFKKFYQKWKARGYYQIRLPADHVIEVSMRKMVYNMKSTTEEQKADAKQWLESRGYTTDMEL